MSKWEYKVLTYAEPNQSGFVQPWESVGLLETKLADLGEQGWELVVAPDLHLRLPRYPQGIRATTFIFKRLRE